MTLSTCIREYVQHRRSLGVQFHGEQVQLSAFVKSVGDVALTAVTDEAVRRYIDGKGRSHAPGSRAFTPWSASIDSRSHVSTPPARRCRRAHPSRLRSSSRTSIPRQTCTPC